MKLLLRQEQPTDHQAVFRLIEAAFKDKAFSDQTEHHLVNRLRKSDAFIPELSIVAERDDEIVGHILLTKVQIKNEKESFESLTLAPVSVLSEYQGQGIGSALIRDAHEKAKAMGYQSVILLGHAGYYPRFGYEPCSKYDIRLPFEAPDENCMVIGLADASGSKGLVNGLEGLSGVVEYPKAFFE